MNSALPALRSLAEQSERMRDAANRLAWDELTEQSVEYFALFDRLMAGDFPSRSPAETAERVSLMQKIAANQEFIREQAEPWLGSTGRLLDAWSRIAATPSVSE